jgi:hypothetical protein
VPFLLGRHRPTGFPIWIVQRLQPRQFCLCVEFGVGNVERLKATFHEILNQRSMHLAKSQDFCFQRRLR